MIGGAASALEVPFFEKLDLHMVRERATLQLLGSLAIPGARSRRSTRPRPVERLRAVPSNVGFPRAPDPFRRDACVTCVVDDGP